MNANFTIATPDGRGLVAVGCAEGVWIGLRHDPRCELFLEIFEIENDPDKIQLCVASYI